MSACRHNVVETPNIAVIAEAARRHRPSQDRPPTELSKHGVSLLIYSASFLFVCLFETGFSVKQSGHPGTHSIDQAGLVLTEIYLSLPPKCWD